MLGHDLRRNCRSAGVRSVSDTHAGVLLIGDTIMVVEDHRWVSFLWSYPQLIPLDAASVEEIARRVGGFRFDRVYGGWWSHVVVDAAEVVQRSARRYIARLQGGLS